MGRGRPRLKAPLPGPSWRGRPGPGRALLPPQVSQSPRGCAHLSWSSRPSGVIAPIPPGGGSSSGEMYLRVTWERAGDQEQLSPGQRPLAWPRPSSRLGVPDSSPEASHYPRSGDPDWRGDTPGLRVEGEMAGGAKSSLRRATEKNGTGLAYGRATPHSHDAGRLRVGPPLLPAGGAPGARNFSSTPSTAAPVSREEEGSSFGGRESESGVPGSGEEDCRGIRDTRPPPGPLQAVPGGHHPP